jgi:CheY-like chemotaxis protein
MVDVCSPQAPAVRVNNFMVRNTMKKKVLIIDDDEVFRYLHSKVVTLTGLNADVITASHGLEALEIITKMIESGEELPTEIFVDLNMPYMNGFEFVRAFNDIDLPGKENIKLIVVTSSVSEADQVTAVQLGIRYCQTKPLMVHDVIGILKVA